jgi:Cys-tRNA(Pro)/Cys-tRNA(Cys) deacylase
MKKTNALRLMDRYKIHYTTLQYQYNPNDLNVLHIAEKNNLDANILYKTLALKGDNSLCVAVLNAKDTLSLKKIAALMHQKKVSLLAATELVKWIGYQRGACSPVGIKNSCPVYISAEAQYLDQICVNAGKRGLLVQLKPADLRRVSAGKWADICQ